MAVKNLIDLANHIGFAAIDAEIETWIEMGEFDEQVRERASQINFTPPDIESYRLAAQALHRYRHPDGPWGYEYCARCMSHEV